MKEVKYYECEICHNPHNTTRKAKACEKKCLKFRNEQEAKKTWAEKNSIAWLNEVERVQDIPAIYAKWVKKMFGATIKFKSFRVRYDDLVSNSHTCPIKGATNWCGRSTGLPVGYPGWQGHASGTITHPNKKLDFNLFSIADRWGAEECGFQGHIRGINFSSGTFGKEFSMGVTMFLQDFPKLQGKLDRYKVLWKSYLDHVRFVEETTSDKQRDLSRFINSDPDYSTCVEEIIKLERRKSELDTALRKRFEESFRKKYEVKPVDFSEYNELSKSFSGNDVGLV